MATPTLTQVNQALDDSARANKRAEKAHREAARAARVAQDRLREFCLAAGIPVETEVVRG